MQAMRSDWRRHVLVATVLGGLGLQLIDRSLFARIPAEPLGAWIGSGDTGLRESFPLAVGVDVTVLLGLLLLGGMLLPRSLPLGPIRPAFALLAGASLQILVSLLLLPFPAAALVLIGAALLVHLALRRIGLAGGWQRSDTVPLLVALTTTLAVAVTVRARGLVILSNDSFEYWGGAQLLSSGALRPSDLDSKRMLAMQALHAPGIALGTDGVISLGVVLLLVAVVLVAAAPLVIARARDEQPDAALTVIALGLAGIIAASSWFWFNALYLNAHLLVAVLLLAIALLVAIGGDHGGVRAAMPVLVLLVAALTLARAESALIVGALLLGTTTDSARWRDWLPVWWTLGAVLLIWNGGLAIGADAALPLSVSGGLVLGLLALAAPTILGRIPARVRVRAPMAVGVLLWSLVIGLPLTTFGEDIVFIEMVRINLGDGQGSWYLTAPLLFLIGSYAVAATPDRPSIAPTRWLVILFVPLTMLAKLADGSEAVEVSSAATSLEALLSGGGRPKWGDSVNRMWTHVALAAAFLGLLAAALPSREASAPGRPTGAGRLVRLIPFVLALVLVGSWWRPDLGPDGPAATKTLTAADLDRRGPELVEGTLLTQVLAIPPSAVVPRDATVAQVCFEVTLALSEAAPASGRFVLELTDGTRTSRREYRGAAQSDGAVKDVCLDLETPLPSAITANVRATSGAGIAVLTDGDGSFVSDAQLLVVARSLDPRGPLPQFASWAARRAITWGPVALGLGLLVTLMPVSRGPAQAVRTGGHAPR